MDKYFYQILVFTGFRKESGTSSKVSEEKSCVGRRVIFELNRFNSSCPVTRAIQTCAIWLIRIARSCSAVPSTRSYLPFHRMCLESLVRLKYSFYPLPRSLGALNHMRVWHDNSGRGSSASWFLKYIIVRDLQTMERDHFICQQWLAVDKGDGAVRSLTVESDVSSRKYSVC